MLRGSGGEGGRRERLKEEISASSGQIATASKENMSGNRKHLKVL